MDVKNSRDSGCGHEAIYHVGMHTLPSPTFQLHSVHIKLHAPFDPQARSIKKCLILNPKRSSKSFGERSLSFVDPSVWNSLPASLRNQNLAEDFPL